MECKVLRDNIGLEVILTVNFNGENSLESSLVTFNDFFTFRARHITTKSNNYDNYGRNQIKTQNIVLISVQKVDKNDESTYKIKLNCPELQIKDRIFFSDDTIWRVVNENDNPSKYTFKMIIEVEIVTKVKYSVLLDDEKITDFKLKGLDGEINIHKAFLAALSPVFKSKVVDGNQIVDSLDIPETSVRTLEDFKKCIYSEIIPDTNLENLLLLASYFKISWLECKCVDKMLKNISLGDSIELFKFSLEHKHILLILGIMERVQSGTIKISNIRKHYLKQD